MVAGLRYIASGGPPPPRSGQTFRLLHPIRMGSRGPIKKRTGSRGNVTGMHCGLPHRFGYSRSHVASNSHRTRVGNMGIVMRACTPPLQRRHPVAQAQRRNKPSRTDRRMLVLDGTGRVGGSMATTLSGLRRDIGILVEGRNR